MVMSVKLIGGDGKEKRSSFEFVVVVNTPSLVPAGEHPKLEVHVQEASPLVTVD